MDDFSMFYDHWKGLAKMEFDASLGEMEDGGGDGQGSFVRGAIVRSIKNKDTFSCFWDGKNNVGIRHFSFGSNIWFSRSHPQRDAVSETATVIEWGVGHAEVRFREGKVPGDLLEGEWRIDGDYVTYALDWILAGLAVLFRDRMKHYNS